MELPAHRPSFDAQYETYSVGEGLIEPASLGNKELKPQHSTEVEFGLDLVLFNRVSTGITYAATNSVDQLLLVPLPRTGGFAAQWQNAGRLEANTAEFYAEAPIIDTETMGWNVRLNVDRTRQEITELELPAYRSSFFYYREGAVFGSFYGTKWATTCAELPAGASCDQFQLNDDGLLVWVGSGAAYTDGMSGLWGTDSEGRTGEDVFDWGMPVRVYGECKSRRQGGQGVQGLPCTWGIRRRPSTSA